MAIPKKGSKRPAASSVGARKKSKAGGDCKIVAKALADNQMLAAVVRHTLGVNADERHEYQATFVAMIGEALSTLEGSLEQTVMAAQAAVDGAETEKASREKAMADAEVDLKAKEEALSLAEATLTADSEAVHSAMTALKEAESAQKTADACVASVTKSKEEVEAAQAKFVLMKEAQGATSDAKAIAKVISQCSGDSQVLVYAPETLQKEPGSRGPFDSIMMKTIEDTLTAKLEALSGSLATAAEDMKARTLAVEAAKAAHASTVEKQEAAKTSKEEAASAFKVAKGVLKDAKAAITSYENDMKVAEKQLLLATGKKQSFTDGAIASYNLLKDKVAPTPEPEQPEAAAPPEETTQLGASEPAPSGVSN